jgi:hypothetical protein
MNSQALIPMSDEGDVEGAGWNCAPYTSREGHIANCGTPLPGMAFLYNRSELGMQKYQ